MFLPVKVRIILGKLSQMLSHSRGCNFKHSNEASVHIALVKLALLYAAPAAPPR